VTVLAAPEAAEAAGAAGGGGALAGAAAGAGGGGGEPSRGVRLAVAIVLLWLACFCFFIAFEGQKLLGEQADVTGGGLVKAMIGGLAAKAQGQETGEGP
jgi:hypothetical protein